MKFVVFSLGCKVNQYEGQSMINELIRQGYEASADLSYADYYIINTCSVTSEADKKSRQAVARALKFNPDAKVIICGCSSQNDAKPYYAKQNVVLVGGTGGKMKLLQSIISNIVLCKDPNNKTKIDITADFTKKTSDKYEDEFIPELTRARGFIKVQDGCDRFCSYCIVPYLRGRSRSRQLNSVIKEAEYMEDKTCEIVVTGIDISDYGKGLGISLTDLIKELKKIKIRKRLGSLDSIVIDLPMLLAMKDSGFCDSFHLSVQSGSDGILKRMNRHYSKSELLEKIELIRDVFPDAGISADIITGFPYETDELFEETVETVRKAKFMHMHIFPYSIREGTAAAKMPQVDRKTAEARAAILKDIGKELSSEFLKSQLGKTGEVYIEENDGEYNTGHTSNNIKIYSTASVESFLNHKYIALYKDGILGEPIK